MLVQLVFKDIEEMGIQTYLNRLTKMLRKVGLLNMQKLKKNYLENCGDYF